MSAAKGGKAAIASAAIAAHPSLVDRVQWPLARIPSGAGLMLYSSMKHRTQLYLDEAQYRWLRQRAGESGSIAAVVRELIDVERARRLDPAADPLLRYLVEEAPGHGRRDTSVSTLDRDLYGR
jgi:hypothetical protein